MKRSFALWALMLLALIAGVTIAQEETSLPGLTANIVNLRNSPSTTADVLQVVAYQTPLTVLGRNQSGSWLYISVNGATGWVAGEFIDVGGVISRLPIFNGEGEFVEAGTAPEATNETTADVDNTDVSTDTSDTASISVPVPDGGTTLSGFTDAIINLRTGPGTNYDVVGTIAYRTPVTFVGRNRAGTWVAVNVQGQQGWMSYTFVDINGDVNQLSVIGGTVSATSGDAGADSSSPVPASTAGQPGAPAGVIPSIGGSVREIFQRGQGLGNDATVFSKVGDSITATDLFLDPIGHGIYDLGGYGYLQPVIDYFSQTGLVDHFSFANTSMAARSGWTSSDLVNIYIRASSLCRQGESPLECEYRVNRPIVALIMIGTNDLNGTSSGVYRSNLERIVEISIDMGVIPVLSTIPDLLNLPNSGRVASFNRIIRSIADEYGVPLWDYWLALQGLPNRGISGDNIHPSDASTGRSADFTEEGLRYGYNMRNLTALMVLDTIWRNVLAQ